MYFWKCWRDTRVAFFAYLACSSIAMLLWFPVMRYGLSQRSIAVAPLDSLLFLSLGGGIAFASFGAPLLGLILGSRSIGTDLFKGNADFLLTRPRSRAHFIWIAWSVGIVEILAVAFANAFVAFGMMYLEGGAIWRHLTLPIPSGTVNPPAMDAATDISATVARLLAMVNIPLLLASVVVTATVIYGMTYLISVMCGSGQRAIVLSISVVLVYSILVSLLSRWGRVSLPTLAFYKVQLEQPHPWYLKPSLQLFEWVICTLIFPISAQLAMGSVGLSRYLQESAVDRIDSPNARVP